MDRRILLAVLLLPTGCPSPGGTDGLVEDDLYGKSSGFAVAARASVAIPNESGPGGVRPSIELAFDRTDGDDELTVGDGHFVQHDGTVITGPVTLPITWDVTRFDLLLRVEKDFADHFGGDLVLGLGGESVEIDVGNVHDRNFDFGPVLGGDLYLKIVDRLRIRGGLRTLVAGGGFAETRTTSTLANLVAEFDPLRRLTLFAGLQAWHFSRGDDVDESPTRLNTVGPVAGLVLRLGDVGE